MIRSAKITAGGRVTIPRELRKQLGLAAGDRVTFSGEGDQAVLHFRKVAENPFLKYVGVLGTFESVEEINAWIRDMRDPQEIKPRKRRKKNKR
jgi:AbrB family looped-hinge helix DNA binding protein